MGGAQHLANAAPLAVAGVSLLGWLPPFIGMVAAIFAIVLYGIQIFESPTFQKYLLQHRGRRYIRRVRKHKD